MTVLGVVVYIGVLAVLVVGLRRPGRADADDGPEGEVELRGRAARLLVVGGGVVLPAVVVGVVFAWTLVTMRRIATDASPQAPVVHVTGHQWWWEVTYAETGHTDRNELHIPVGEPVEVRLASSDVVHSFWVVALAGKLDALPDHTTTLILQADEPGEYQGRCAEFCGLNHAAMDFVVVAHPPDEYRRWLAAHDTGTVDE